MFAYACEPGKGSEPGAGWAWAWALATLGETWVITRANNAPVIEPRLREIDYRDRLHFVYVDLPRWARAWKRGQRGVRLYYVLWQVAALRRARALERTSGFDLVWHLTLANAWMGSLAPLVGPPFVYGPVGGGVASPPRLLPSLGMRGILEEALRNCARVLGRYANPLARLAWRRARLILANNPETIAWLPKRHRRKAIVFPHVVLEDSVAPAMGPRKGSQTALFAGRLVAWKGAALAVRALEFLPGWRLLLCGAGPEEARLRRLARRSGVAERVEFLGELPRKEVFRLMRDEAQVFLFPSLHDEGGWVVSEALGCGLPVVCLDLGGPTVLGGRGVAPSSPRRTAEALARAVLTASPSNASLPRASTHAVRIATALRDAGLMAHFADSRAGSD